MNQGGLIGILLYMHVSRHINRAFAHLCIGKKGVVGLQPWFTHKILRSVLRVVEFVLESCVICEKGGMRLVSEHKVFSMRKVGHIDRLQVQLDKLKKGGRPNQYYDPAALRVVPALRLTSKGVLGLVDGQELLDVHHADHEHSRNRPSSGISLNFSSHYERMKRRFGRKLDTGCAGENIHISPDSIIGLSALSQGLIIESRDGDQIHLQGIQVAHPCLSFSAYALSLAGAPTDDALKETLNFLDGGTRGFYCDWMGDPVVVRLGDSVFLPE